MPELIDVLRDYYSARRANNAARKQVAHLFVLAIRKLKNSK